MRHAVPNVFIETHPRTQMSQTEPATAREAPQGGNGIGSETLKLFVVSDIWRQTRLLSSKLLT